MTRTQICTGSALDTHTSCTDFRLFHAQFRMPDQRMVFRQYQNPAKCFCDHAFRIPGSKRAHHGSAQNQPAGSNLHSTGCSQKKADRHADRGKVYAWFSHLTRNRNKPVRHRFPFKRAQCVQGRGNTDHCTPHTARECPRWHCPPGSTEYQRLFNTDRVNRRQEMNPDRRVQCTLLQSVL